MPIITDGPIIRRGQTLEEFETPFSDYIGAKWQQGLDSNPVPMIFDYKEFNQANTPLSPRLTAAEINTRSTEAGVKIETPADGLSEGALQILIERRQRQKVQEDAISRSSGGGRGTAGFGVSLAAGLLDPLNIGMAFIPVVGEARYATMIGKAATPLARAGVRAGVGAVEGAVGVAVMEPFNYAMHQTLQDDYHAMDSLLNIGFGTVLGGGLHVGAGAIRDTFDPRWWDTFPRENATTIEARAIEPIKKDEPSLPVAPEKTIAPEFTARAVDPMSAEGVASRVDFQTREAALRTAVAHVADGRMVDVEPVVKIDPSSVYTSTPSMASKLLRQWMDETLQPNAFRGSNAAADVFDNMKKRVSNYPFNYEIRDVPISSLKPTQFGEDALNDSSINTANDIKNGNLERMRKQDVLPIILAKDGTILDGHHRYTAAGLNGEKTIPALVPISDGNGSIVNLETYGKNVISQPQKITPDQISASAARQSSTESVRIASVEASAAADERLAKAPKSESMKDAEASLAAVMKEVEDRFGVPADKGNAAVKSGPAPDVWYHGTSSKSFDEFNTDVVYLTTDARQAKDYSESVHLGGNIEQSGRVLNVEVKPGEVKNINSLVDEAVMDGDDIGDAVDHAIMEARADGYRYVDFDHPSSYDDKYHAVRVALYPKDDLKIKSTPEPRALSPIELELKPYDDAIKSSEELGRAAKAAAICDLRS